MKTRSCQGQKLILFSSATEESYPQLHTRTLDWDTLYVHKGSAYILIKWNRKALK